MGGLRAAVGVVLGVISLAVLSLHIALCIHYPSPLFAVTLLLNPSLWLFLGLIGMGCALLLTHRDQQRKVRAGHCTSCHPHYGSTVDTKWRGAQETKWRGGIPCQRGPSRAIYSYNGNLHKFYASYGTINENQVIEMKRSAIKSPASSNINEQKADNTQKELNCSEDIPDRNRVCGNSEIGNDNKSDETAPKDEKCMEISNANGQGTIANIASLANNADTKREEEITAGKENQNTKDGSLQNSFTPRNDQKDTTMFHSPQEMLYRDRRYCDCPARYGAIYHYPQLQRSFAPRCNRYIGHDRAMSRYERKLLMRCKLKPANDVPVELFAAKGVSSKKSEGVNTNSMTKEDTKAENSKTSVNNSQSSCLDKSVVHCNDLTSSQNATNVSDEEISSAGCTDTTSLSSIADISSRKDSLKLSHKIPNSDFIVPVKHMPTYSAQTSTSLPLGSPYNGKSKHIDQLEDHESTSLSSDHTTSEKDPQDQDVVSISSKSSLLPSSPEKSMTNRELTRSPLWRPFKSSIIGRKRLSDEDKSSNEDFSKSSLYKETTNEDYQESLPSSFKSVFANKISLSKSGGEHRQIVNPHYSDENISSESSSSSASPAMKEKRRQQLEVSRSPKSKSSFSRKISSAKPQSLQKNSKTLLLSPAKAVRSLVFKNAQKRTSRLRKTAEAKNQQNEPPASEAVSHTTNNNSTIDCSSKDDGQLRTNATESSVSPSHIVLAAASVLCSTSAVPAASSSPISQANNCPDSSGVELSSSSSTKIKSFSEIGDSSKKLTQSEFARGSSISFVANESNVSTPLLSSPVTSSNSSTVAAISQVPITSTASSNTPSGSPSVRPKEPKKPKIKLKGKHRSRAAESVLLLTADSDD